MRDKAAEEAEATAAAESLQMIYRSRLGDGHEEEDDSRTGATEQHSVATNGVTKAFLSVQDLIQAAIQAEGPNSCASLRQIYTFCENKTLLYKRSARSRLLSENKHYKSQVSPFPRLVIATTRDLYTRTRAHSSAYERTLD